MLTFGSVYYTEVPTFGAYTAGKLLLGPAAPSASTASASVFGGFTLSIAKQATASITIVRIEKDFTLWASTALDSLPSTRKEIS